MSPDSLNPFEESQETQLNAVDAAIVSRLQENARAPLTKIADDLELSEAYVRRRLRLLLDHDVLAITAVADPRVFGLESMAWIGLEVEHAKATDVAERLLQLPDVDYVVVTLGRFRVMAEVACESIDHLYQVVLQLRQLPSVRRIETFVYMRLLRQQFVWQTAGAVNERAPVQWQGAQHLDELDLSIIRAYNTMDGPAFERWPRIWELPSERHPQDTKALSKAAFFASLRSSIHLGSACAPWHGWASS